MTPEQEEKLDALHAWMQERLVQQLSFPVDDSSKNSLGAAILFGQGSKATTQSVSVGAVPTSINVPAAYAGTIIVNIGGTLYEIPYL